MHLRIRPATRKWLGEVGNIVLGVLIALGLGWVANGIKVQGDVAAARRAIKAELGKSVGQSVERARIAGCVDRKLNALARIIDQADRTGRLPPMGAIGAPPIWAWTRAVWDRAISSETLANFRELELFGLPGAFELVPVLRDYNQQEFTLWTRFNVMVGPGRAITPQEVAQLRFDLVQARAIWRSMARLGATLRRLSEQDGIAYDVEQAQRYAGRSNAQSPICQPIGTDVPALYGLAPAES